MGNKIKGGLSDKMSISDIANKHGVSVDTIKAQIKKGAEVELEHTNDKELAKEIATDHVVESPTYYDKLATIEEGLVKRLIKEGMDNLSMEFNDGQIKYYEKLFGMQKATYRNNAFFKNIMKKLKDTKKLSKKEFRELSYLIKNGTTMYGNNKLTTKN